MCVVCLAVKIDRVPIEVAISSSKCLFTYQVCLNKAINYYVIGMQINLQQSFTIAAKCVS